MNSIRVNGKSHRASFHLSEENTLLPPIKAPIEVHISNGNPRFPHEIQTSFAPDQDERLKMNSSRTSPMTDCPHNPSLYYLWNELWFYDQT